MLLDNDVQDSYHYEKLIAFPDINALPKINAPLSDFQNIAAQGG